MEQLIQLFTDRYLTREEVMYRLPVSMPISLFWPALANVRRSAAIEQPLKTQAGEHFRFVLNKSIEDKKSVRTHGIYRVSDAGYTKIPHISVWDQLLR